MMVTMRMSLLILILSSSLAKIDNDPHSHTTTVMGRSVKCFHYAVMKRQVIEVKYRVKNMEQDTEPTINFLLIGSEKLNNWKRFNRKSGNIQATITEDYQFCFENIIQDIKYVEFEVTMEKEVVKHSNDDHDISQVECLGQHMISRQVDLDHPFLPTIVHERSTVGVVDCEEALCPQRPARWYNWFMRTFADIFDTCEDDQDLEVINRKFVDMLEEYRDVIDIEDIIRSVEGMTQSSKVLEEYVRALKDRINQKEDRKDTIQNIEHKSSPLSQDEQNIAILIGELTPVCILFFLIFRLTKLCFKQKQKERTGAVKSSQRVKWKKDRRNQNSRLNIPTPIKTECLTDASLASSKDSMDRKTSKNKDGKNCDIVVAEKNIFKNGDKKDQLKCCGIVKNGNVLELYCSANCHYRLHHSCSNESLKAVSKKSLTGQEACLTPDCWGLVTSLVYKHQNGKVYRTMKLDPVLKSSIIETKRKVQTSSEHKNSRKILTLKANRNVQQLTVAQNADVRHLQIGSKVIHKNLVKEDEIRKVQKLKKRSIKNIKNIQRIHIEPLPMIQRKVNEFVSKDQILKLLKNMLKEENDNKVIDRFLDERGMALRRNIPIIIEEVLNNLEMRQIFKEEDVMESLDYKDELGEDQEVCSICIDILEDGVEVLDCTHKYHNDCISEWMKQNPVCPECRAYIKPKNDFPSLIS